MYMYIGWEAGSIRSTSFKLSCFHPGLPGMYLGFYLLMQSTESRVGTSEVRVIRCKILEMYVGIESLIGILYVWVCVGGFV